MKDNSLWIAIAILSVGAAGYFLLNNRKFVKSNVSSVKPDDVIALEISKNEKLKYSPAMLKEYDLIVPPFKATKKAEAIADEITAKRFQIDATKVKNPLYL